MPAEDSSSCTSTERSSRYNYPFAELESVLGSVRMLPEGSKTGARRRKGFAAFISVCEVEVMEPGVVWYWWHCEVCENRPLDRLEASQWDESSKVLKLSGLGFFF